MVTDYYSSSDSKEKKKKKTTEGGEKKEKIHTKTNKQTRSLALKQCSGDDNAIKGVTLINAAVDFDNSSHTLQTNDEIEVMCVNVCVCRGGGVAAAMCQIHSKLPFKHNSGDICRSVSCK